MFKEWSEEFLRAKRLDSGAADLTLEAYQSDLAQFLEWLSSKGDFTPQSIPFEELQAYFSHLQKQQKQSPASISRKLSCLRQFFKFCCTEKSLTRNPLEAFEGPQPRRRLPQLLSFEEVSSLLDSAEVGLPYPPGSQTESLHSRDKALVYLIYATGARISEILSLTPHQVEFPLNYLKIKGKGAKERFAPFTPMVGEILKKYVEIHRPQLNPQTDLLFLNRRGFALSRQGFWKTLKNLSIQAGIKQSVSPHVLRHSFASHLLESGMNLRSLQMLLGHSDLSTTQIYTHLNPEHLKSAHQEYHPRGKNVPRPK